MRWISLLLVLFSFSAMADTPVCTELAAGNYCTYKGKVDRVYINESGLILIYFDTAISAESAAAVGFTIGSGAAAGYVLQTNSEFGKLLYSTALAAKASGAEIGMQMRGTTNSYLKIDRIWIY